MKRRTLAGNCGVGVFVIALVAVVLAFGTHSWLVSDYRITGAKLDKLGLWVHCFRSLPDVNDDSQRRFFVGCRWIYDPFTTGYDEIRGFLLPGGYSVEYLLILTINVCISFSFHDRHTIFLYPLSCWRSGFINSGAAVFPLCGSRSKALCIVDYGMSLCKVPRTQSFLI